MAKPGTLHCMCGSSAWLHQALYNACVVTACCLGVVRKPVNSLEFQQGTVALRNRGQLHCTSLAAAFCCAEHVPHRPHVCASGHAAARGARHVGSPTGARFVLNSCAACLLENNTGAISINFHVLARKWTGMCSSCAECVLGIPWHLVVNAWCRQQTPVIVAYTHARTQSKHQKPCEGTTSTERGGAGKGSSSSNSVSTSPTLSPLLAVTEDRGYAYISQEGSSTSGGSWCVVMYVCVRKCECVQV